MEVLRPSLLIDYKFVSVNNESRNITVAWSCKLDLFIVSHLNPLRRKGGLVGRGGGAGDYSTIFLYLRWNFSGTIG